MKYRDPMDKTVDWYLQHGFDQKAAEYFAGGRRRITSVVANDDMTLALVFDNGEKRVFDVAPLVEPGTVFAFLADLDSFRRVYLDDQHCVSWDIDPAIDSNEVWSNKVELSSDTCYMDSVPIGDNGCD